MQWLGLPWDCVAILVALAVLPPLRGTTRVREFLSRPGISSSDRILMYRSTMAFQWIAAAIVAWRTYAHRWSWFELGIAFGKPLAIVATALALAILLALLQLAGLRYYARHPEARRGISYQMLRRLMPQSRAELPAFVVLLATVSVCEEFLYRGFALDAFQRVFRGSAAAGIVAAAVLFAIGHLYQGRQGAANTFLLAVVFGIARVWTGSLAPGIFSHFVTDSIAGIGGPRVARRVEEEAEGVAGKQAPG